MELIIGSDHRGFELKEDLKKWLANEGHDVIDVGAIKYQETDDYPQYGFAVAEKVAEDPDKRKGIAICGSGVGMVIAANKVKGIRAGQAQDAEIAVVASSDDDINVLAIASDYLDIKEVKEVIRTWLSSSFSGEERHKRRLQQISKYEQSH